MPHPRRQPHRRQTPLASGTVEVPPTAAAPRNLANGSDNGLRHFFAVIDRRDTGARNEAPGLSEELPEKDVCLSFARHLLKEFQNRGISALILRGHRRDTLAGATSVAGELGASRDLYRSACGVSGTRCARLYFPYAL